MANNEAIITNTMLSNATIRNWSRLNYTEDGRLSSRANKRLSQKYITPVEYFSNCNNLTKIQDIVSIILKNRYSIEDSIFSLAINLLSRENILYSSHVQKVLGEYEWKQCYDLLSFQLPLDEIDVLGSVYQCLLNEGEKIQKGHIIHHQKSQKV